MRSQPDFGQFVEKTNFAIFQICQSQFTFVNPKFYQLFGFTPGEVPCRALHLNCYDFEDIPLPLLTRINQLLDENNHHDVLLLKKKNGTSFRAELELIPDLYCQSAQCWGTLMDITQQKASEEALQESEQRYRVILHTISDPVMIVNEKGNIETTNDAAKSYSHINTSRMIVGSHLSQVFPKVFSQSRVRALETAVKQERIIMLEEKLIRHGEEPVWYATKINPLFDISGVCSKVVIISRDITQRKKREEALRFFSKNILNAQEEERRRISRELHDGLGQSLTAIRLDIRSIEKGLSANQQHLRENCRHAMQDISSLIDELRRIAMDLTPTVLEDLGLTAAIRRLISEFSRHYKIKVDYHLIKLEGLLVRDDEINIYRILQEIFTNIGLHAQADSVSFSILTKKQQLYFIVQDDGIGFDLSHELQSSGQPDHLGGLRDLHQRAEMLNGTLAINTQPSAGTKVTLITDMNTKNISHGFEK